MPILIQAPAPPQPILPRRRSSSSSSSSVSVSSLPIDDSAPLSTHLYTPGQTITTDPQWMRGHGTTTNPPHPEMKSTVAGTLQKTNKLLSITPLHARYQPSIGDLVVGRVVNISATQKRWSVDIAAPLLASLPLSAINLPGGVLRRRTAVDELNVRTFFAEGDLVVAEVQDVRSDGSAGLHTRSLRYGKLRNGMFLAVRSGGAAGGRQGGVVRSRRQMCVLEPKAGMSAGKIDVILGVNGYVFLCKHTEVQEDDIGPGARDMRGQEKASMAMYASANEKVDLGTRREIARVGRVVKTLSERGVRVDEDTVRAGYEISVDMEMEGMDVDAGKGRVWTSEDDDALVKAVLAASEAFEVED